MESVQKVMVLAVLAGISVTGCGSKSVSIDPAGGAYGEKMIWASHDMRPGWTVKEPEAKGNALKFVGLSEKHATEKASREDALRTATNNIVRYIGTMVQDKFEEIRTSYGLSTEIMDPTQTSRSFQEQLASAFARRIRADEWYIEKYFVEKTQETYFKTYVMATVPEASIEQAYKDTLDSNIEDLKKKRDAANEEKAKNQFENAMKAFEAAKAQGFSIQ